MFQQLLDSKNSGRYSLPAITLLMVGRGNPEFRAHNRANAVFLCVKHDHIQSMVGRAGQSSGWPGSLMTGISTPVRLTTHKRGNFGGELNCLSSEVATMATIPAHARFIYIFRAIRHSDPSAAQIYLHSMANTERQARKLHEPFYDLELIHCSRRSKSRRPRIIQEVVQ